MFVYKLRGDSVRQVNAYHFKSHFKALQYRLEKSFQKYWIVWCLYEYISKESKPQRHIYLCFLWNIKEILLENYYFDPIFIKN